MDIVLAHDSITQLGGAERVAFCFNEMFPNAPFLCLVCDAGLKTPLSPDKLLTSALQTIYSIYPKFPHLLPLLPWAVDNLKVPKSKILLSSSSSFIKGLRKYPGSIHINYCHTPTRFLWTDDDYINQEVPWLLRPIVRFVFRGLRKWDLSAAKRVDYFIANSKEVQQRIKKIYNRDSEVIYPFIDETFWKPTRAKQGYFLIAGRLQPHKGNELVIEAFNALGLPLHVVGSGRQENYLKSIAKPNITFLGRLSDEQLRDEYSGALGYIYPQLEDFGLMPVEAAACGTPTLAFGKGGALETVQDGSTGSFFYQQSAGAIIDAVKSWNPERFTQEALISRAQEFGKELFKARITTFIKTSTSR